MRSNEASRTSNQGLGHWFRSEPILNGRIERDCRRTYFKDRHETPIRTTSATMVSSRWTHRRSNNRSNVGA